jgi:DNA (cytosine-5)-methyltransferase 1
MVHNIPWKLSDIESVKKNGRRVFSCFHCGGGSTMGYKLAGFDVIGGVEIDPKMMTLYRKNHNPNTNLSFLMGIQEFVRLPELPSELNQIDILDGSPPCSSFSMAGSREDLWGKEKKFREGQVEQVLDDLFFSFIEVAKRLRPKVIVAENVKGLISGNARYYVKQIIAGMESIGYSVQVFILNAASMGVPQARERVFFIASDKTLGLSKLELSFNEKPISISNAIIGLEPEGDALIPSISRLWPLVAVGKSFSSVTNGSYFSWRKCDPSKPSTTITATHCLTHWSEPRMLSQSEIARIQSFPDDYDFMNEYGPYVCGMSVPPLMMERIAIKINEQWFDKKTSS